MTGDLRLLLRVLWLFRPYGWWMALGVLLACLTVLANVGLMAVAGGFIASMAIAGLADGMMNYFLPAAAIRLLAIIRTGGRYAERLISHEATFRLLARLRLWLFWKMEPLAPAGLQDHRGADLTSRIQSDIDTLQHAYLRLFTPIAVALIALVVIGTIIALYSGEAALWVLALLLVAGAIVPGLVLRATAAPAAAIVDTRAEMRIAVVDALQGMTDIKLFGDSARNAGELARLGEQLGSNKLRVASLGSLSENMIGFCAGLAMWGATLIAIVAASRGTLARFEVPVLTLAALASFEAVASIPLALQRLGEVVAAARRIFALADATPAIAPGSIASAQPRDASIALEDVRLRYGDTVHWALDGATLAIGSGRRVALTGPSGSGKSSIVRLLLRFWEYQGGRISVGQSDLRACDPEELRNVIGVVSQDTQLRNATIRDNLSMAAPGADETAIRDALRIVQLKDFVEGLEEGLDTWVGEGGVRLSVGQARRLVIAMVVLRKSPILILDEPTEGLDATTGHHLLKALTAYMTGRTVLIITHNPEQVLDLVDEVILLENGRVVKSLSTTFT